MLLIAAAVAALAGPVGAQHGEAVDTAPSPAAPVSADQQRTDQWAIEPRATRHAAAEVGFALAAETVASSGSVCRTSTTTPCILGSGGGMTVRIGYRLGSPWYFGGAYEFTRHDSANLLRLAILQQLRAEARYYIERGQRTTGFLAAGAGFHVYGNDWGAIMGGGLATIGGGVEFELSPKAVVGVSLMYRLLVPRSFKNDPGVPQPDGPLGFGLAHVIGLEFALEVRDPVPHW
jgi:hypothetical protein